MKKPLIRVNTCPPTVLPWSAYRWECVGNPVPSFRLAAYGHSPGEAYKKWVRGCTKHGYKV